MIQSLHHVATSIFAKTLLFLLVASFALWGIGDIFRSTPANSVVKVGKSSITASEMKFALDNELSAYRRMLDKDYNKELVQAMGIPQQVLAKLVQQRLVQEEARALGLMVSQNHLKNELRANPAFQGENGTFDREFFNRILANNGLNENQYIDLLTKQITADMLMKGAFSGIQTPNAAARLAYAYQQETRVADVLFFPPALVADMAAPSQAELESYYKAHADRFRAEEYRTFSVLTLDAETLAKEIQISDEDILIEYQQRIDEYREPEKREVKQLLFNDKNKAKSALAALKNGIPFEQAGRKFGALNTETLLGTVTASGVIPEAEKAVFSLKAGAFSDPIESAFGWHVFEVSKIIPSATRPVAEVKEEVANLVRSERIGDEIYTISNTLQDDLAAGISLEEAARNAGVAIKSFGPVNREGKFSDDASAPLPEALHEPLSTAFSLEEGKLSDVQETKGGSYYAVRADTVMPERVRALDEVKPAVIDAWKQEEKAKRLKQLAEKASSALARENAANVANETKAIFLSGAKLTRESKKLKEKDISSEFISAVFAVAPGKPTNAIAFSDGSYAVAKITAVEAAETSSEAAKKGIEDAGKNLEMLYADELYQQYMAYLRNKHGVSDVNQSVVNSLIQ